MSAAIFNIDLYRNERYQQGTCMTIWTLLMSNYMSESVELHLIVYGWYVSQLSTNIHLRWISWPSFFNYFIIRFSPMPRISMKEYDIVIYALGGAHCLFSVLVLVTYFLSNHPTLPSFSGIGKKIRLDGKYFAHSILRCFNFPNLFILGINIFILKTSASLHAEPGLDVCPG